MVTIEELRMLYGNVRLTELQHSDYLAHYGIKGQKWGVRRFQNADRTWTAEGKIRYGNGEGSLKKKTRYGQVSDEMRQRTIQRRTDKKSNNLPAVSAALMLATDIYTLNPVGLAFDTKRIIDAGVAYSKEKKFEKKREKAPLDAKTGLHLKTSEMTEKEDMRQINPGFKNFNTNTENNCMLCSTAYELRRRGYDVAANKVTVGYFHDEISDWFKGAKPKNIAIEQESKWKQSLKAQNGLNKQASQAIKAALLKEPEGARGNLMVNWGAGGGHSVVWEIQNGQVILRDCQSNKTYTNPDRLLNLCISADYVRTDNKQINFAKIKEAVH